MYNMFLKKIKKTIAFILTLAITAMPFTGIASANQIEMNSTNIYEVIKSEEDTLKSYGLDVNVIEDNENNTIIKVIEGEKAYISNYDKINNTVTLDVIEDNISTEIMSTNIDENSSLEKNLITPLAIESYGCIHSKLKYYINMKSWTITNSKGSQKQKPETVSHKDNLYKFKSAVRASRTHENSAHAKLSTAQISAVGAVMINPSSVGAISAVIISVGGAVAASYDLWESVVDRNEADRYFAIL